MLLISSSSELLQQTYEALKQEFKLKETSCDSLVGIQIEKLEDGSFLFTTPNSKMSFYHLLTWKTATQQRSQCNKTLNLTTTPFLQQQHINTLILQMNFAYLTQIRYVTLSFLISLYLNSSLFIFSYFFRVVDYKKPTTSASQPDLVLGWTGVRMSL
ncbi:unnamed protein product [Orchesella dallaii]|uniref:Uncharacterized protein n=1 Tax=Orchesella dallaii TaxID=48710 RepID=A0ABP1RVF1_9HEXA